MSEDDVRDALERYAAAWVSGDLAAIVACYHDDFTLRYFGANVLSGVHVGKVAALAALAEFGRRTSRSLVAVDAILAGSTQGAIVARETLGAQRVEVTRVLVYSVDSGLLRTCAVYDQEQGLIDRLVGR